jgi:hypothetical protein
MPRLALDVWKRFARPIPVPQGKLEADSSQPGTLSCYKPRAASRRAFEGTNSCQPQRGKSS